MKIQRFSQGDIETFLRAIDRHLAKSYSIVVIGGAAAAIAYHAVDFTVDIDTTTSIDEIAFACNEAKKETGLHIPIGPAGVFDAPFHYEDRVIRIASLNLKKLSIMVPEVHDLILMKVIRGDAHDLEQIEGIKDKQAINLATLEQRFRSEMKHVIGNQRTIRLNFLAMVARLFGEEKAERIEKSLELL